MNERCPNCGKFCGVVCRWRGPSMAEIPSCTSCGLNPPKCSYEDGTVKGCKTKSTHEGSFEGNRRNRPWCEDHAPEDAESYPYYKQ